MKSTSEEGSNKGTHDEKMEAGDTDEKGEKKRLEIKRVQEEKQGDGCERNYTADLYL